MAVQALLRFIQGPNSGLAGQAVAGTLTDGACTVSSGNNTGVVSWKYEMLYVPPGSAVPLTVQGPGVTTTLAFTPDVSGTYRVRLTVVGATLGDSDIDIRCFSVPFTNGLIAPPYQRNPNPLPLTGAGGKPDEMNIGGQPFGWDGDDDISRKLLYQALRYLDDLLAGGAGPFLPLDGSAAMTGNLDMGLHGIAETLYHVIGTPTPGVLDKQFYIIDGQAEITRDVDAPHETVWSTIISSAFGATIGFKTQLNLAYNGVGSVAADVYAASLTADFSTATINVINVEHDNVSIPTVLAVANSIRPLRQWFGTPANSPNITTTPGAVNVTAALASGGAGNVSAFAAFNNGLIIGNTNKFSQIQVVVATPASGNGVDFEFSFSTGVGTWSSPVSPEDRTAGLTDSGAIRFDFETLAPSWALGTGGQYLVRMLRKAVVLATAPIITTIQLVEGFLYGWSPDADVFARSYRFSRYTSAPGADPTTTLWYDIFDGRLKINANTLAYLSEVPSGGFISGTVSTTAGQIPSSTGAGSGTVVQASLLNVNASNGQMALPGTMADTSPLLVMSQSGSNGGSGAFTFGTRTPIGNVTANPGAIYVRISTTTSAIYLHVGSSANNSSWLDITGFIRGTVGATAGRVPTSTGDAAGLTLQASLLGISSANGQMTLPGTMADTTPLMSLSQSGSNGGAGSVTFGTRTPVGNVTSSPGGIYVRISTTTSSVYLHIGSGSDNTSWLDMTSFVRGTVGTTADKVPTSTGNANGLTVQASLLGISASNGQLVLPGTMADTSPLLVLSQSGTNGGSGSISFSTRTPIGNVTGNPGALFVVVNGTSSQVYQHRGSSADNTSWSIVGGGEVNTASNVGTGASIFKQKTGVNLEFNGVLGNNGIVTTVVGSDVTVSGAALLLIDGTRAMTGTLNMASFGLVSLGYNIQSPSAITSQQNDYSPTNWSSADIVRLTFTGAQTITGFSATATATRKLVQNVDSADTLTLANESASSTAANRISCPGGVDLVIPFGGSVTIQYDVTASRWRPVEVNNGAVVQPAALLHAVRRSVQLTNVTSTVFPAFDTTLQTLNSTYWSFSSGSWTCVKAHTSIIRTQMSYQVNSGSVFAGALAEVVLGSGGVYTTQLQAQSDSAYSTTDTNGHVTNMAVRAWAVNDQFRIYYSTTSGAMDILATRNTCEIIWVSG